MDEFPDTFLVVTCHREDRGTKPWVEQRITFYDFELSPGYPFNAYDGLEDAWPIEDYRTNFISRQAVPTEVTIDITGVEVGVQTWDFTADVCLEPGTIDRTLDFFMVETLDHYPTDEWYYRSDYMQKADDEVVHLTAGNCVQVTRQLVFADDPSWSNREDIRIIAWVQEPAAMYPAEVHQAAQLRYPFTTEGLPFFEDGFESGDTTVWASTTTP